jgi:hypothetical protein
MVFCRILILAGPIGLSSAAYAVGCRFAKGWNTPRDTGASLSVLSGLLAALAILVPLLAASSPWSRSTGLRWWFLLGVLSTGVAGIFGTVFCMILLQNDKDFKPSERRYVPATISGTWICLLFLGTCVVFSTFAPGAGETIVGSLGASTRSRFAVAHDLPELHTDRRNIENAWGAPEPGNDQILVYRTTSGVVVFCLDSQGLAQKIIETQGVNADAVTTVCK